MPRQKVDHPSAAGRSLVHSETPPVPAEIGRRDEVRRVVIEPSQVTNPNPNPPPPIPGGVPHITLSATATVFTSSPTDPQPAPQDIQLTNTGDGILTFSATSNQPWLLVSPAQGTAPSTLRLSVSPTGLAPGTYNGSITITATGADNTPQTITITLKVEAATPPPVPAPVPPINRHLWLGYFKSAGRDGDFVTQAATGAGNCAVVLGGIDDFREDQNWRDLQTKAADDLNALGGSIIIGDSEAEILNMKSRWDRVAAIFIGGGIDATAVLKVEERARAAHAVMYREALPNRPIIGYLDTNALGFAGFHFPDGVDWFGLQGYIGPTSPPSVEAAQTLLRTTLDDALKRLPVDQSIILIAQAFDRNGLWTNETTLAALQAIYADYARADARIKGILWFAYARLGGTLNHPTLRPWHEAIFRACPVGRPATERPDFPAYGAVTRQDCSRLEGWCFLPSVPDTVTQVQIFDRPRRDAGAIRLAQLAANINRPDIISVTKDAGNHGYAVDTPASLKDGATRALWTYGVSVRPEGALQVPLINTPQSLVCTGGGGGGGGTGPIDMMPPNEFAIVQEEFAAHPDLVNTGEANALLLNKIIAKRLFLTKNTRWGMLGKNGDPSDLNDDVIAWRYASDPHDLTEVDIFFSSGGPGMGAQWIVDIHLPHPSPHIWVQPPDTGDPVPAPPPIIKSGVLTASDRGFFRNNARFDWKGVTWFMGLREVILGNDMNSRLSWLKDRGVTVIRVLGMVNWQGFAFGPHTSGYYAAWPTLAALVDTYGMVVEATIFADTATVLNMTSQTSRLDVAREIARQLRSYPNVVFEVANEPTHGTQAADLGDPTILAELAQAVKEVDSSRLVALGAVHGGDESLRYSVPPANYLTYHSSRLDGNNKWDWVTNEDRLPMQLQTERPAVSDEPINAGDGRPQDDPNPAHWFAWGLLSRVRRFSTTFHYPDGKFCILPTGVTESCLNAWQDGLREIGFDIGGAAFKNGEGVSPFIYPTGVDPLLIAGRVVSGSPDSVRAVAMAVPGGWAPQAKANWSLQQTKIIGDAILVTGTGSGSTPPPPIPSPSPAIESLQTFPGRNGWFPRFSFDGRRLATGNVAITVSNSDGTSPMTLQQDGGGPVFYTNDNVVFNEHTGFGLHEAAPPYLSSTRIDSIGANKLRGGGGVWGAYLATGEFATRLNTGYVFPFRTIAAVNDVGTVFVVTREGDQIRKIVNGVEDPVPVHTNSAGITEVSCVGNHLVWQQFDPGFGWQVYYKLLPAGAATKISVLTQEFDPTAIVDGSGNVWVMSYNESLIIRKQGQTQGHLLATGGQSFYPHCAWDATLSRLWVAWTSSAGLLSIARVDLSKPVSTLPTT